MATKHAWSTVKSSGGGGGGGGGKSDKFMKLKQNSKNKFRPVGDPVIFYRYYVNNEGKILSAITDDPSECPVAQKHGLTPRQRGAINVIDRENGGLRILEVPVSILQDMKAMWEGDSPGGQEGGMFGVIVEVPGGDKRKTRYKVCPFGPSPVTAEEKKMIKETAPGGKLYNLEEEFKATPVDEIEAKLGLAAPKADSSFDDDDAPAKSKKAAADDDMDF